MSKPTVGDFIVDRLHQWGIDRVFGYSGDGINGVMSALRRNDRVTLVQPRHEELAAFMACGHAKYTAPGRPVYLAFPQAIDAACSPRPGLPRAPPSSRRRARHTRLMPSPE